MVDRPINHPRGNRLIPEHFRAPPNQRHKDGVHAERPIRDLHGAGQGTYRGTQQTLFPKGVASGVEKPLPTIGPSDSRQTEVKDFDP